MTIQIIFNDNSMAVINNIVSIFYNVRAKTIVFHGVDFEKTYSKKHVKTFWFIGGIYEQ